MTLDSSALIAILFSEPGSLDLVDRILAADNVRIGAPTLVEARVVFTGRVRKATSGIVELLLKELGVAIVPFGERESHLAVEAFRRFGRRRHPAALNYGDCLAYATAVAVQDTLLFVGDDFAKTDVTAASPPVAPAGLEPAPDLSARFAARPRLP
jgi:ribonuclease VapC